MIHFTNNHPIITLELRVKPANVVYRFFILLLAALFAVAAVGILIFGSANPFLRLVGTVLLGLFVSFLVKSLLWNTHGKEVYEISTAEFSVINDYGKFKSKPKTIPLPQSLTLYYIDTEYPQRMLPLNNEVAFLQKRDYKIVFDTDGILHHSVVEHSKEDMERFVTLLPEFGKMFPAATEVANG